MKKHIILISIIIFNIITLVILVSNYKNTEYPEKIFEKETSFFDGKMRSFIEQVSSNIESINSKFTHGEVNKSNLKNYFVSLMDGHKTFNSCIYIKNHQKFLIQREKDSYVIGYDNTEEVDLVNWERLRNGKTVSNWDESFVLNIRNLNWFKSLKKNPNTIRWFFDATTNENKSQEDLFYCGYYFAQGTDSFYYVFRFSRMVLLQEFPSFSNFDDLNLLVETSNGSLYNLSTGINEFFSAISSDSLHNQVNNHLAKFKNKNSGIFTFRYNQAQIWSFFRKFNPRFGLNFYMLTIPESQILNKTENKNHIFLAVFISLLILSGIGIYFLYRRKKTEHSPSITDSLADILIQDENRFLEFKSSLRWDYRQQKPNPALEEVVVKTIAAFGNSGA